MPACMEVCLMRWIGPVLVKARSAAALQALLLGSLWCNLESGPLSCTTSLFKKVFWVPGLPEAGKESREGVWYSGIRHNHVTFENVRKVEAIQT